MRTMERTDLLAALADGPLTLDALHARLGAPDRDALDWALAEAVEAGAVVETGGACDDDGLCSSSAPRVLALPFLPRRASWVSA